VTLPQKGEKEEQSRQVAENKWRLFVAAAPPETPSGQGGLSVSPAWTMARCWHRPAAQNKNAEQSRQLVEDTK
jgi:hypothetical protein